MRTITAALASRIAATMCRILNHGKRDAKAAKVQANAASISLSNERSLIVFIVVVVSVGGVRIGWELNHAGVHRRRALLRFNKVDRCGFGLHLGLFAGFELLRDFTNGPRSCCNDERYDEK